MGQFAFRPLGTERRLVGSRNVGPEVHEPTGSSTSSWVIKLPRSTIEDRLQHPPIDLRLRLRPLPPKRGRCWSSDQRASRGGRGDRFPSSDWVRLFCDDGAYAESTDAWRTRISRRRGGADFAETRKLNAERWSRSAEEAHGTGAVGAEKSDNQCQFGMPMVVTAMFVCR